MLNLLLLLNKNKMLRLEITHMINKFYKIKDGLVLLLFNREKYHHNRYITMKCIIHGN
jgi:hypothetical protein